MDEALARTEIARLRTTLATAQTTIRRQLGRQLEGPDPAELLGRTHDLTAENHTLRIELDHLRTEHAALAAKLDETQDDLHAARTSLRRMIRTRN